MADLSRFQHPKLSRSYARISEEADRRGAREHRERLLSGLKGRVIEIGAGNGRNFAHYPETVTEVVAVEPDATMRDLAAHAPRSVPVTIVAAHAEDLPGDGYDAAVTSLVLCSVPSPARALSQIGRVLRPGGELRFYEHVRSDRPFLAAIQDLTGPLYTAVAGGCHLNRDAVRAIERAGFTVEHVDRFGFSSGGGLPRMAHVIGRGRRPA